MTRRKTFTITAPDGTVLKRQSENRTYTHGILVRVDHDEVIAVLEVMLEHGYVTSYKIRRVEHTRQVDPGSPETAHRLQWARETRDKEGPVSYHVARWSSSEENARKAINAQDLSYIHSAGHSFAIVTVDSTGG